MDDAIAATARARLLFVVTEDWYFVSHRLPMARAAARAGYEVHVAARVTDHGDAIAAEGFVVHPLAWRRGRSPTRAIGEIAMLRALYRRLRPDVVHHVALKPTAIGSIAARGVRDMAVVNSIAGLGYVFASTDLAARGFRVVAGLGFRRLMNRRAGRTIAQNPDDFAVLQRAGVKTDRLSLIRGSGVDVDRLRPTPPPARPAGAPLRAAFVGRMLAQKGVRDLIAAHRILRERGVALDLALAGAPDPLNPTALGDDELRGYGSEPGVEWLGHVADVGALWAAADIAVAPSRGGEGVPKSLLEAAACGRPMASTDTPGCREIAIQGRTAELAPPGDPSSLADALSRLIDDAERRRAYGLEARRLAETEFSSERIGAETVAVYAAALAERSEPTPSAQEATQ